MKREIKLIKSLGLEPKPIERNELLERLDLEPKELTQLQREKIIPEPIITYQEKSRVLIYPPETLVRIFEYRYLRELGYTSKFVRRYFEEGNFLFMYEEE